MLLRLAYLSMTNAFALLRLLPRSDQDKDVEILVLRHQITVLEHQLGTTQLRFSPADRAFVTALLHQLPIATLRQFRLPVRPETVLRQHRDLLARRHAARSHPKRPGRPRTVRSIRLPVLRLARENPTWGYRRIHGELLVLGITVAASTVWQILKDTGADPVPDRTSTTWADFLRSQAEALLACDFFEISTVSGTRLYVLAVIERWIQSCRHELLDRTLIWNHQHLLHVLRKYEQFYDVHRPHQGIANARPLHPLPPPITNQAQISDLDIRRRQRLGGILNEYHHAA